MFFKKSHSHEIQPSKTKRFSFTSQLKKDAILFAVFGMFVVFLHLTIQGTASEKDSFLLIDLTYFVIPFATAGLCFAVAKKNAKPKGNSEIFGKSHFSLGIAFVMIGLAEFVYIVVYQVILDQDPYPSIVDIFYFLFFPFVIYYLMKNITYFIDRFTLKHQIFVTGFSLSVISLFTYATFQSIGDVGFDFWYSLLFISCAVVTTAFAVVGISIFRFSILGYVWLFMTSGILISAVADLWYYHLENVEEYTLDHVVNSLYILSWILIAYSLYKNYRLVGRK